MKSPVNITFRTKLLVLRLLLTAAIYAQEPPSPSLATPEMIKSEFAAVPCRNEERIESAKVLFEKMGAPEADLKVEKYKRAVNLVVQKPATSAETIVIGAHYDKVSEGCGAIDNWTGVVALAHIYGSLKDVPLKKRVLFVAFGNEEAGLHGSHAMVDAIEKSRLGQYCAMINVDSLGMTTPQALDNTSSKKMIELGGALAKELNIPFKHASVAGTDADSSSFRSRKIPAITIHGMSREWRNVLHSRNDQPSRVNTDDVYLGYRLALAMLLRVDQSACGEFR